MANVFYRPVMGDMLAPGFRLAPAVVFYVIFVFGLVFFAVKPGLLAGSGTVTLVHGALLGFVAYATYDLTNQATLKNWSWTLTIADMVWGTLLSTASAYVGYCVTSRISG
ncbi:putative membrane protein [Ochrobactrum sp. RC6B]|nr:putative membrane protein [Brucella intermedia]MBB3217378.1 putative membrane protein [Ochrobactrum sp. RC6B]NYD80567.1 putative membrane protein [Brucella intermedia]